MRLLPPTLQCVEEQAANVPRHPYHDEPQREEDVGELQPVKTRVSSPPKHTSTSKREVTENDIIGFIAQQKERDKALDLL